MQFYNRLLDKAWFVTIRDLDCIGCLQKTLFWDCQLHMFLPLLWRFNPTEPVVEKSVIL
jgi:hypothetical protein